MRIHFLKNETCRSALGRTLNANTVEYGMSSKTYDGLDKIGQQSVRQQLVRETYSWPLCNYNLGRDKVNDLKYLRAWMPESHRTYRNEFTILRRYKNCPEGWILKHSHCSGGTGIIQHVSYDMLNATFRNPHFIIQRKINVWGKHKAWSLRFYFLLNVISANNFNIMVHTTPLIRFASENTDIRSNIHLNERNERNDTNNYYYCDVKIFKFMQSQQKKYIEKICTVARLGIHNRMSPCFRIYAIDTITSRGGKLFVTEVQRSPQLNGNTCTDAASGFVRNFLRWSDGLNHTFHRC